MCGDVLDKKIYLGTDIEREFTVLQAQSLIILNVLRSIRIMCQMCLRHKGNQFELNRTPSILNKNWILHKTIYKIIFFNIINRSQNTSMPQKCKFSISHCISKTKMAIKCLFTVYFRFIKSSKESRILHLSILSANKRDTSHLQRNMDILYVQCHSIYKVMIN